ncbi:helix-turn-helix domain-containing protein [Terrisporobacter muris]|uniref:Helix-turn-helix domain-containing protein n=1 Tax=Terrisporobacter muris TaxID=2963284 RepID=A0A9X2S4S5_9FIRM|nr:helix-turn-helix transcriptional regulator [Terrisporobacter muris]MCR1823786.1 helix-turn-helix domain-containing protein [Terrisporobacter muris]
MYNLGNLLKTLRKSKGISMDKMVEDLKQLYGISIAKSTISKWENNKADPTMENAKILCNYFDVAPDYLLGLETKSNFNPNEITEKDEKSIQRDLKKIMDDFKSGQDGPAFYNGVELDNEELELIEQAMELALRSAKMKNKAKYTPKKYRK